MSALALERQAIAKKDFPTSRRGYEPVAVDRHLESVADEVERLRGELEAARAAAVATDESHPPEPTATQSLSLAASEQVRLIVEAAESSAADIERSARMEAARTRTDADAEASRTRDEAVSRSQDHVGEVGQATASMLQRVDAMEGEIGALLESLRTGTHRLAADLSLLHGNLGDLYDRVPPDPAAEGVTAAREAAERGPEPVQPAPEPESVASEPVEDPVAVDPAPPTPEEPEPGEPAAGTQGGPQGEGDVDGARLIALNMALNGQSREETGTYLRDNFDLRDRDALLDEVYATVEG